MSPRTFPTTFVWDHGGTDIHLFISKPNGNETLPLNKSDDGTFEVTTELGQGRYEYCFTVDGKWTHDPDLPAIKNENGHYSNMLKIVDPKINFSNKAAKLENLEKVGGISEGGIHNFVEKCYSDATINEVLERENVLSLSQTLTTSNEHYSDDSDTDEFPDLDDALEEALDLDHPKFIAESPHPARKLLNIPLPSSNTNLNLSQDKINEINMTNNTKNNHMSKTEKAKQTSQETQEQGILTEKEYQNIERKDKQKVESKSSETEQEIPPNNLNAGKENGISTDLKPCSTETENITKSNIYRTGNEKTKDENKHGRDLEESLSSIDTSEVIGVGQDKYVNKVDEANTIDESLILKEGTVKASMYASNENLATTLPDDPISYNMESNMGSKVSAEPTPSSEIPNSSTNEEHQSINTVVSNNTNIHVEALMESNKIKETDIEADLSEHEIMQSYEDEISNYYAIQEATTLVEKASTNVKEAEENVPNQEVVSTTQHTDACVEDTLSDDSSKIQTTSNSEMSYCSEEPMIEGDVNGNIIDSNTHPNAYPTNIIYNQTSNPDNDTLLNPELNESNLDSLEIELQTKSNLETTKSECDIKDTKSDIKEIESDMIENKLVLKETKSDIKETNSDSKETASYFKENNSNIKETKSDFNETKSDIKETISDTKESQSDKKEIKSDIKESISDETKTTSELVKSNMEMVRSQSDTPKSTSEVIGIVENVLEINLETESKCIASKSVSSKSKSTESILVITDSKSDETDINEKKENITKSKHIFPESKQDHQRIIVIKEEQKNNDRGEHEQNEEETMVLKETENHQEETSMIGDEITKSAETKDLPSTKIELVMLPEKSGSILTEETDDLKVSLCNKLNGESAIEDGKELRSNKNISDQDCDTLKSNEKGVTEIADLQNSDRKNSMTSDTSICSEKHELIPSILISIPQETEIESNIIHEEAEVDTAGTDSKETVRDEASDRAGNTEECGKTKNENETDADKIQILTESEKYGDQLNLKNEEIKKEVTNDTENVKEANTEAENCEAKQLNESDETFTKDGGANENVSEDTIAPKSMSLVTRSTNDLIDLSDHQNESVKNLCKEEINLKINDVDEDFAYTGNNESEQILDNGDHFNQDIPTNDPENTIHPAIESNSMNETNETENQILIEDIVNELVDRSNDSEILIQIEKSEEIQNSLEDKSPQKAPKDLFSQVNNTLVSIQKSKSNADLKLNQEIHNTDVHNQDVTNSEPKKDIFESVKDNISNKAEKKEMNKNLITKNVKENIQTAVGVKNFENEETLPVQSPMEQRREAERIKMERLRMSKKLDEVFGVIRSESVDDMKTEIKVRGMGDVNLKRQKVRKTTVEHNKMYEYEQKRMARQQISMPEKPATFKKPKQKVVEKVEEPPKPIEEVPKNVEEKPKPKKKSNFVFIQKPPTPPKEPTPQPKEPTPPQITKQKTPDLQSKFWPTPELPIPQFKPEFIDDEDDLIQLSPEKPLPLKIGINGFDRVGRLAFRAAFEAGLEITAVNDPFIPLHYMVYSLKFDLAHNHSKSRRKEITVTESPLGELIVNGKIVTVFTELDPRKIPWDVAGVNYVIEATESLQSKINARHHLQPDQEATAMKDIVNRDEKVISVLKKEHDASGESPTTKQSENKEPQKPVCNVKKVIIASNSTEFPSFGIGINDERISQSMGVIGNISAQANALILPLKIILDNFGIRYCSYTLLKAIIGPSKDIKCPTLGPATHSKAIKWDFSENLVPTPCPVLEEETLRFLPALRGKLHGIVVYTPVPEVSMFDLTICVEKEAENIYKDICQEMRRQAEGRLKNVMKYVVKMGDETSASCIFTGCPQSVVFDERSGCQIDRSTVKIVLWFDNEYGFANRVVDLVKKAYQINLGN